MGHDHLAVGQLDIRQESLIATEDASVGEGREQQGDLNPP